MNAAEELLMLLQDGTPYSLAEIVDLTGMKERTVRNTIYKLTGNGLLSAKPVVYRVTPKAESVVHNIKQGAHLPCDGARRE